MSIVRTRTIRFSADRVPDLRRIRLGMEGDNLVERLEFVLPVIAERQSAVLMMDGAYANAVDLKPDNDRRYGVDLTAEIIGPDGETEAYIRVDGSGGEVWQSEAIRLVTRELPDVETEIEQRFPTAVETMLAEIAGHRAEMDETLKDAKAAADKAETAVVNPPIVGNNGNWWLWDFEAGQYVDSGKPSQGGGGEGGGATYHSQLMGRDADNQHPINAIAGLRKELDGLGYTLPPATADTLGGMMVGVGLVADEDGRVGVKSARPDTIAEIELEETVKEVIVPLSQPLSSAIIMVYPPELPDDYSMYVYVLAGTITDYETGECGKLYITDAIVLMKSTNRAKVSINVINGIIFAYWDNLPTAHVASGSAKFGNKTLVAGGGISDSIIIRSVVAGHDLLAGTIIKVYGA